MQLTWTGSVLALCMMAGCAAADDVVFESNLTYATAGDIRLQLDLARPTAGNGPFPAIVFIHGGGWQGGNRHHFRGKLEEAAQRGYVAATISYRLTQPDPKTFRPRHPFPAQIHDCKAAIRWLRAHAEQYKVDPRQIAVAGASAGGHLSLLVGLTSPEDGLEGELGHQNHSSRVQAVVNIFGPTDLPVIYRSTPAMVGILKFLCNGTPDDAAETYVQASPVTYATADDPPILTLHGDADKLVPVEQAQILDAKLKEVGITHELKILTGQGHGFSGAAVKEADDATWAFLEEHLGKKPR